MGTRESRATLSVRFDPAQTLVIANPAAASGHVGRHWDRIAASLERVLGPLRTVFTERRGHATVLAREALWAGRETILSLGGDGTHSEVVSGLLRDGPAPPEVALGILPVGTGGDFQRMLHGSASLEEQAARLVEADIHRIDVGVVRCADESGGQVRRLFLNETSFGTSGLVCSRMNASSKRFGGQAAYLFESIRGVATYDPVPVHITLDGQPAGTFRPTTVMVGNGRYAGAGMLLMPSARLADGMLDVTIVPDRGLLGNALLAPWLYGGQLEQTGRAIGLRGHTVRIELADGDAGAAPIVEADGEPIGTLPMEATVIFEGLRVLGVRPEFL